jgi:hypothetical protein
MSGRGHRQKFGEPLDNAQNHGFQQFHADHLIISCRNGTTVFPGSLIKSARKVVK